MKNHWLDQKKIKEQAPVLQTTGFQWNFQGFHTISLNCTVPSTYATTLTYTAPYYPHPYPVNYYVGCTVPSVITIDTSNVPSVITLDIPQIPQIIPITFDTAPNIPSEIGGNTTIPSVNSIAFGNAPAIPSMIGFGNIPKCPPITFSTPKIPACTITQCL